ncbi:uncharacterized protein LOC126974493 [Leptidea sinapis]|uniref:DUF4794 domain-containing protein n=1 Tax=Leptidea sinapis TaxID=189913 RepID=A0A5E4QIJ2_9NEOP|nr:uncharacterized protein LOC126974493 [Leptidea sinapis]VVC98107.1 unnamed protein product [Leptidea sinapis]
MKFVCVLLIITVATAEPPRYRLARFRSERQEVESAPYPPAGYRPEKEFNLPPRQESPPATSYGVPANSYGAPFNTYLTPQKEYGAPEDTTEAVEKVETKAKLEEEPNKDAEVISSQGAYYVLLPGSQLQRVQFKTENDVRNMAYTARLQYKQEDRAPIFVYTAVPQYQSAAYVQLV